MSNSGHAVIRQSIHNLASRGLLSKAFYLTRGTTRGSHAQTEHSLEPDLFDLCGILRSICEPETGSLSDSSAVYCLRSETLSSVYHLVQAQLETCLSGDGSQHFAMSVLWQGCGMATDSPVND